MENNYRKCVGITLVNDNGLILICKRIDGQKNNWQYSWQMPQGGIDKNELPKNAAVRELKEETSITNIEIIKEHPEWLHYDFPNEMAFNGKFKGQIQKWFLMKFKDRNQKIIFNQKHPEFCEFKWANKKDVLELIVPFKKNVYKQVIKEFNNWLA